MSTNGGTDRVSNKQLYDELGKLRSEIPGRREIYAVIATALVIGQIGARVDVSVPLPPLPPQQSLELLSRIFT